MLVSLRFQKGESSSSSSRTLIKQTLSTHRVLHARSRLGRLHMAGDHNSICSSASTKLHMAILPSHSSRLQRGSFFLFLSSSYEIASCHTDVDTRNSKVQIRTSQYSDLCWCPCASRKANRRHRPDASPCNSARSQLERRRTPRKMILPCFV